MQLVLADISVNFFDLLEDIIIEERCIRETLLTYSEGRGDYNDEEKARKEVVTEIMNCEDQHDISGFLRIRVELIKPERVIVTPSIPDKSIFKCLSKTFQGKVKIFVCLYQKDGNNSDTMINVMPTEEMTIHPELFTYSGKFKTTGLKFRYHKKMHVKLVADLDVTPPIPKRDLFAQKILEKGTFSDVIISAGNGAQIKSHKVFLSVCSPVLEAMLASGMEETQTGRVDMSDLSEEGVKAFLRYVYYDDMQLPNEDIQVAYELFYAGHKYDMPGLEDEMMTLLHDKKNEDIGLELAFKIFMFTRTLEPAGKLKAKALEILESVGSQTVGLPSLESEIETFLGEANYENLDVALAFKMYMFTRNSESAVDLKKKALRVLTTKWSKMELLQEYNDIFEKPCNSKTAKQMCRELAMAMAASI